MKVDVKAIAASSLTSLETASAISFFISSSASSISEAVLMVSISLNLFLLA